MAANLGQPKGGGRGVADTARWGNAPPLFLSSFRHLLGLVT